MVWVTSFPSRPSATVQVARWNHNSYCRVSFYVYIYIYISLSLYLSLTIFYSLSVFLSLSLSLRLFGLLVVCLGSRPDERKSSAVNQGGAGIQKLATDLSRNLKTSRKVQHNLKLHPESPSTRYLRLLVPETVLSMVFGTRQLKSWLLGPSGYRITADPTLVRSQARSGRLTLRGART